MFDLNIPKDATILTIEIVVKRNGRSGFVAELQAETSANTWIDAKKKLPGNSGARIRSEMAKWKAQLVEQGQPVDTITIRYV